MSANESGDPPGIFRPATGARRSRCAWNVPFTKSPLEMKQHPATVRVLSVRSAHAGRSRTRTAADRDAGCRRAGRQSGVVVISGEAGIGKTALLDDTARTRPTCKCCGPRAASRESGLGFSGLHQLLLPALHLVDPSPRNSRGAGGRPDAAAGPAPERFAVGVAATLSLLSRSAEDSPAAPAHRRRAPSGSGDR